jgi:hypothetical protein
MDDDHDKPDDTTKETRGQRRRRMREERLRKWEEFKAERERRDMERRQLQLDKEMIDIVSKASDIKPPPRKDAEPSPPAEPGRPAGNPRKPGARHHLSQRFFEEILDDWRTNGPTAIAITRSKDPAKYLQVIASVLPRQVDVSVGILDELRNATDDEVMSMLRELLKETGLQALLVANGTPAPSADGTDPGPGSASGVTH